MGSSEIEHRSLYKKRSRERFLLTNSAAHLVAISGTWKGGRAAECGGLENRFASNRGNEGSNPSPSASECRLPLGAFLIPRTRVLLQRGIDLIQRWMSDRAHLLSDEFRFLWRTVWSLDCALRFYQDAFENLSSFVRSFEICSRSRPLSISNGACSFFCWRSRRRLAVKHVYLALKHLLLWSSCESKIWRRAAHQIGARLALIRWICT